MNRFTKEEIEKIFINSGSQDELFDAFQSAVEQKIDDPSLYRILLWNKALSAEEILMYSDKVCRVFPEYAFNIHYWSGKIFASASVYSEYLDKAFISYMKASEASPEEVKAYLAAAEIYNSELDLPHFNELIKYLDGGIKNVQAKSKLCFAAEDICKAAGHKEKAEYYRDMGMQFQKSGL